MALFGEDTTIFLQYFIYLTDPVQVGKIQTEVQAGGQIGRIVLSPDEAAAAYGVPIQLESATFNAPGIRSDWFNTEKNYPTNQRTFERQRGGFWGLVGIYNRITTYYWVGKIVLGADEATSKVPAETLVGMAQRRFIDGFEMGDAGESGGGNIVDRMGPAASRTTQGWGLLLDSETSTCVHPAGTEFPSLPVQREGWERFYMRFVRFPAARTRLWATSGSVSGGAGGRLYILPSGQIVLANVDAVGTVVELFVSAVMPLLVWKKIDILWKYNDGTGNQRLELWMNGALLANVTASLPVGTGLGQTQFCATTALGDNSANTMCVHFDDWIQSALPTPGSGANIYPGHDWNYGSHVALVRPSTFAASHSVNWSGDPSIARLRGPVGVEQPNSACSVASSRYAVVVDAALEVDEEAGMMGIASMCVVSHVQPGGTQGQLGYKLPGGAEVLVAVTQGAGGSFAATMYAPAGVVTPLTPLAGLELVHIKGLGVGTANLFILAAQVELIGLFGVEDVVHVSGETADAAAAEPITPMQGTHNAPYPRSIYARPDLPQVAPFIIHSGTYVGNGTFQDLTFRVPVHWLWIRPLTGTVEPFQWWSPMAGGHKNGQQGHIWGPTALVVLEKLSPAVVNDQESQVRIRINGSAQCSNANTVVYQYVAISDPGMRLLECGTLDAKVFATPYAQALRMTAFVPLFAQVWAEVGHSVSTNGLYLKGAGHAANAASPASTTEAATALSMAAGSLTGRSGITQANGEQTVYSVFRNDDGTGDAGLPNTFKFASYTGDGTASRTISLAPASGKRPLFAIVVPHNAATVVRDPSHTGVTSHQYPTTTLATTGITGGAIDSLSVGSALNSNGIIYDVFVIMGSATAGNGGFSTNGEFEPLEPSADYGYDATGHAVGPWFDFPPDPELDAGTDDPDVEPGGDSTDFGDQCVDASTAIINRALSLIGVSKRITLIVSEQTQEAATARTHYSEDLNTVLRAYPWAFATRYAKLVLVAGSEASPVNGDWLYSYRAPTNMKFARRIINQALAPDARQWDLDPPKFRVGSDATGALIYSNEGDLDLGADPDVVSVELEYTIRPTCAASSGDDLFRTALTWLHASSLAPTLSRDLKRQNYCMQMFLNAVDEAKMMNAREKQEPHDGDPDWISGR